MSGHSNGNILEKIEEDVFYLKESVGFQITKLAGIIDQSSAMTARSLDKNTAAMEAQTQVIKAYMTMQKWALPLPLVTLMFAVLLVLIFGKEAIEWFFGHGLFHVSIQ